MAFLFFFGRRNIFSSISWEGFAGCAWRDAPCFTLRGGQWADVEGCKHPSRRMDYPVDSFALYWSWPLALLTCFKLCPDIVKLGWRSTSNNESYIKVFISCELCWGCLSCGLEDVTCNPIGNAVSLFIWTLLPGFLCRVSTLHFVWRRVLGHTRLRLDSSLPVVKFSCCVEYRCWRLFSRQCHIQSPDLPRASLTWTLVTCQLNLHFQLW